VRDGKGQFYRTLNLDKPTRKLIRWYREIKFKIDRNIPIDKEREIVC